MKKFCVLCISIAFIGLMLSCSSNKKDDHKDLKIEKPKVETSEKTTTDVKPVDKVQEQSSKEEPKVLDNEIAKKLGVALNSSNNVKLYEEVAGWLETPYVYAGMTKDGVDCSGFVINVYKNVYGVTLDRTVEKIYNDCVHIDKSELVEGDLVFFNANGGVPSFMGIYLKDGRFVNVSASKGVIVCDLNSKYYSATWFGGGHIKR